MENIDIMADQRGIFEHNSMENTKKYIRLYAESTNGCEAAFYKLQQRFIRYKGYTGYLVYNPYEDNPFHSILWRSGFMNCAVLSDGRYYGPDPVICGITPMDIESAFRNSVDELEIILADDPDFGLIKPFRCPWRTKILEQAQAELQKKYGLCLSENEQYYIDQIILGELSTFEAVKSTKSFALAKCCKLAHKIAVKYEGENICDVYLF